MVTISDVRPSPIAGRWYSGDPRQLSAQVDEYLRQAKIPALDGDIVAVVAPHAGHRYSGHTAGYAFRSVMGQKKDLVAVVSPLHSMARAPLLTSAHLSYATPLGDVPINGQAVDDLDRYLEQDNENGLIAVAYDEEHSLEIELPFLQRALDGPFQLLPVMIHTQSEKTCRKLAHALAQVLRGRSALLVASTDLSHFYPLAMANELDKEMLHQIEAFSPEGALKAEQSGTGFACGIMAVATVLWAAAELGANQVKVLHHSTSADETGDQSSVVGYGAAAVLKTS